MGRDERQVGGTVFYQRTGWRAQQLAFGLGMLGFSIAVFLNDEILRRDSSRGSINSRELQIVFAVLAFGIGVALPVTAILSLLRLRPDVVLDETSLRVRQWRWRRIAWAHLVVTPIRALPRRHRTWLSTKTVTGFLTFDMANGTHLEFTEDEFDQRTLVALHEAVARSGQLAEWREGM